MEGQSVVIYIAGPYTHPDPIVNTRAAVLAGEAVLAAGAIPVVPHLSMLWHLVSPHDVDWWYNYDLQLLARCDALLRLPGASTGADREVVEALKQSKPVALLADFGGDVGEATRRLMGQVRSHRETGVGAAQ